MLINNIHERDYSYLELKAMSIEERIIYSAVRDSKNKSFEDVQKIFNFPDCDNLMLMSYNTVDFWKDALNSEGGPVKYFKDRFKDQNEDLFKIFKGVISNKDYIFQFKRAHYHNGITGFLFLLYCLRRQEQSGGKVYDLRFIKGDFSIVLSRGYNNGGVSFANTPEEIPYWSIFWNRNFEAAENKYAGIYDIEYFNKRMSILLEV